MKYMKKKPTKKAITLKCIHSETICVMLVGCYQPLNRIVFDAFAVKYQIIFFMAVWWIFQPSLNVDKFLNIYQFIGFPVCAVEHEYAYEWLTGKSRRRQLKLLHIEVHEAPKTYCVIDKCELKTFLAAIEIERGSLIFKMQHFFTDRTKFENEPYFLRRCLHLNDWKCLSERGK